MLVPGRALRLGLLPVLIAGCTAKKDPGISLPVPTFEAWAGAVPRLDERGRAVHVVDGDVPVTGAGLREFYDAMVAQRGRLERGENLAPEAPMPPAHVVGGKADHWDAAIKKDLSYCVSPDFGSRKANVARVLAAAAAAWEKAADVDFRHVTAEDATCDAANPRVLFRVAPLASSATSAIAFHPSDPPPSRTLLLSTTAVPGTPFLAVVRHALGHVLGFRHPHSRPEAAGCFADGSWSALPADDPQSVMDYPRCNAIIPGDFGLTPADEEGVARVYGVPSR